MEPINGSSSSLSSSRLPDSSGFELPRSDLSQLEVSPGCKPSFFHADSGKKALELLRMLRFDLLVTGDQLPDMPVSQLIRRVRAAWPWQKWAMVGSMISPQDEIAARTLGAMAVFDAPPDWEVLGSLAAKAAGRADASAPIRSEAQKAKSPSCTAGRTGGTHAASQPRKARRSRDRAALDRAALDRIALDGIAPERIELDDAADDRALARRGMADRGGQSTSVRRALIVPQSAADRSQS